MGGTPTRKVSNRFFGRSAFRFHMANALRSRDIPVKLEPILMPFDSARRAESNEWSNFPKSSRRSRDPSSKLSWTPKLQYLFK